MAEKAPSFNDLPFSLEGAPCRKPWTYSLGAQSEWLSQTQEEIIEPELPIVDAHHHLFLCDEPEWYKKRAEHPNIVTYMERELAADVNTGHNIVATVFVQCYAIHRATGPRHLMPVGETEMVQGVAAIGESQVLGTCKFCAGIVALADPFISVAEMREVLDAHRNAARNLRGIRFVGGMAEQIPFTEKRFHDCVAEVVSRGLSIDLNGPESHPLNFQKVLGGILGLAELFPQATIVLDHCGGAVGPKAFAGDEGAKIFAEWKEYMVKLAKHPNIHVKLGGLLMPLAGHELHTRKQPLGSEEAAELIWPYDSHCLDCFTASRCMFESNFPMDKCSISYPVLWNAFKRVANKKGLSAAEKTAVFSGTASKVYRLGDVQGVEQKHASKRQRQ